MSEDEIEDLRFEIEHKHAESLELRAIIRRLTTSGTDPMDPDAPCPHLVRPGENVCVLCGEELT
jgi:hypothetical protein